MKFKTVERLTEEKPKPTTTMGIRITYEDLEYLRDVAHKERVAPSFIVSRLVRDYVTWLRDQK